MACVKERMKNAMSLTVRLSWRFQTLTSNRLDEKGYVAAIVLNRIRPRRGIMYGDSCFQG